MIKLTVLPVVSIMAAGFAAGLATGCEKKGGGSGSVAPGDQVAEASNVQLDLPTPIPEFKKAPASTDGTHSVTEMRRQGEKFISSPPQSIKVKGYVTWRYDCIEFLTKEMQTKAAVDGKTLTELDAKKAAEKEYDDHRERCDKPHFYIGEEPNSSMEKSIWVVDVPLKPVRPWEIKDAKKHPELYPEAPTYSVGDQVVVEGEWATKSNKGFINLDGLLMYKSLTNLTVPADPAEEPTDGKKPPGK